MWSLYRIFSLTVRDVKVGKIFCVLENDMGTPSKQTFLPYVGNSWVTVLEISSQLKSSGSKVLTVAVGTSGFSNRKQYNWSLSWLLLIWIKKPCLLNVEFIYIWFCFNYIHYVFPLQYTTTKPQLNCDSGLSIPWNLF